jgi:hypothetical protein
MNIGRVGPPSPPEYQTKTPGIENRFITIALQYSISRRTIGRESKTHSFLVRQRSRAAQPPPLRKPPRKYPDRPRSTRIDKRNDDIDISFRTIAARVSSIVHCPLSSPLRELALPWPATRRLVLLGEVAQERLGCPSRPSPVF